VNPVNPMSDDAQTLLREALALPSDDRAGLVAELLASLDEPDPADAAAVQEAWAREIERRARRAVAEQSRGEDWDVVRERLAGELADG
jgi:putative addiction module component (TIGR02574 family)